MESITSWPGLDWDKLALLLLMVNGFYTKIRKRLYLNFKV
jgi:hypothetical protein